MWQAEYSVKDSVLDQLNMVDEMKCSEEQKGFQANEEDLWKRAKN